MSWNRQKEKESASKEMSSCICSEKDSSAAKSRCWQAACQWLFWSEGWLYPSILKHTQFIAFIKRSAENYLSTMMLKRNICSECLNIYTEKTVQKHLNFVCSTETAFHLMLKNFLKNKAKILYIMQFLMRKPWNAWYQHQKTVSWGYLMRVLHQLSSQSCQRLSELSVA
jgi:hypothetical protein